MLGLILEWMELHQALLWWLSALSVLMFVGSLIAVPWLVVRIPSDYFTRPPHHLVDRWKDRHPALRIVLLSLKNFCGVVLVLAGIAMLVLPGQGILTIVVGLFCLDFPGKFALEQRLVQERHVAHALNWIRAKAHHPPLVIPEPIDAG